MSLTRTLDRLFRAVRAEARRNPAFAARLEAIFAAHLSRREPSDVDPDGDDLPPPAPARSPVTPPPINPIALFTRAGAEGLGAALADLPEPALRALVGEHNLDPAGEAQGLDRDGLVAHVLAHARKRVERDKKLFDY